MVVAGKTRSLTKTDSLELRMNNITVRNQEGKSVFLGRPYGVVILESFPEGRFNNSEYDVKGIDPTTNATFGENDNLEVESVTYRAIKDFQDLSFDEYVSLGRPERIKVRSSQTISPIN